MRSSGYKDKYHDQMSLWEGGGEGEDREDTVKMEVQIGLMHLQVKMPRTAGSHHKLGERNGTDFSSEPSEETNFADFLILYL